MKHRRFPAYPFQGSVLVTFFETPRQVGRETRYAALRIRMHAVQAPHGKDSEVLRSGDQCLSALRRSAGACRLRPRNCLQRRRLVCGWLRQRQAEVFRRQRQSVLRLRQFNRVLRRSNRFVKQGRLNGAGFQRIQFAGCARSSRALHIQLGQEITRCNPEG
jgi:hypothetical protein